MDEDLMKEYGKKLYYKACEHWFYNCGNQCYRLGRPSEVSRRFGTIVLTFPAKYFGEFDEQYGINEILTREDVKRYGYEIIKEE